MADCITAPPKSRVRSRKADPMPARETGSEDMIAREAGVAEKPTPAPTNP